MPIRVQAPDGSIAEFPEGTPKQVITRAMAQKFGGPQNPPAPAPTTRSKAAPATKPMTARERGFAQAKQNDQGALLPDWLRGTLAGINKGAFMNAPDYVGALIENTADIVRGKGGNLSWKVDEYLGRADYERSRSPTGNFIGELAGSVVGLGKALKGASAIKSAALSSTRVPVAAKVALDAASKAATVKRTAGLTGKTLRATQAANLGRISAAGAASGAAYAAADRQNVSEGAAMGAVGGLALVGLGKAGAFLARPFSDMLGRTKAPELLRRFTSASMEEMQAAASRFRQQTGAEPTLFEILPLVDRKKLTQEVVGVSAKTNEATAAAVRQRLQNVGPEMARTANQATAPGRQRVVEQMAADLATARQRGNPGAGLRAAEPNRGVLPGGYGGDRSPADLDQFMRGEATARMQSTENTPIAENLRSIFPTAPRLNEDGTVEEVFSDPEVNQAVIAAAKGLRLRLDANDPTADIAGLTAGDLTRILRGLAQVAPGTPNKAAAMRAEQRIMDYIDETNPAASAAVADMRANWAARNRMFEGMVEGSRSRTRESIPSITRETRNAYQTNEGAAGRFLGQSNKLAQDFGGTGRETARAIEDIAQSGQTQAALRQNLGDDPAAALADAARAQENSIRAFGSLSKENAPNASTMGLGDLFAVTVSLAPSAMIRTKAWAFSRMLQAAPKISEPRALELVDSLFSQNAATRNAAIAMLGKAGPQGREALALIGGGLAAQLGAAANAPGKPSTAGQAQATEMPVPGAGIPGADQTPVQEANSYDEVLADWEANADPEMLDLIDRQFDQESGGQQFGPDGEPLESSAGALGVAQVMPDTAPEAAALAGLEWDEEAYRTDPAYNKLLGIAYMEEMLRKFDGDVELALAAYNAGPGAVKRAGGVPNFKETQDYVAKIAGGR